nr:hypothetical protein [Lachnospiraceae bacterium]
VVHNVTNVGRASGLSVYFPYDNTDLMDQMMDKYDSEGYNADYTSFIHDFTAKRNGDDLTEWTVEESDPVADESDETGFSIQLSDEEVANFSKAYATVWEKDAGDESGESYVLWLESLDTALDENGKLSANYDGKIFYLTDDSGDKVPIFAIQTELTDDYSEYVTYITKGHASEDQHNDAVYIRVDKEHPEGVITGIYKVENNENIKCPDKQVDKIEDGDYLLVMYFGRKIRFNDDGTVEPFDTWEESSYWGAEMDVEGQLKVSFEKPSLEHDYIGLFDIRDTQGKEHDTNYLDVHIDGKEGNGKTVYEEALGTVGYYL